MVTVAVSYAGLIIAALVGWPLWALVLAAALPWGLVYGLELTWTYRHFKWVALFYLLVLTQAGHFAEHVAQMVQLHLLGLSGSEASGIFSRLDVEWVHFGFNTWIMLAVLVLLIRYRTNPWLWVTLVIAAWHQAEHTYLITRYLQTVLEGDPGLLAQGGVLAGGLPVRRPDLHFLYNVVETLPLFAAFGWTLRHSYNEWLAKAFPGAPESVLVEATPKAETRRFRPNVMLDCGDQAGYIENGWLEQSLSVGPVAMKVVEHCLRCALTTRSQADLPKDAGILHTAQQHNENRVGIYAEINAAGTVRIGDTVSVR